MTQIRISRAGIRKELLLLVGHIADVRHESSDDFIRKVTSLESDTDLQRLLSDTQISAIAARLAGLMTIDIDATGYIFTSSFTPASLTHNALKRLLKTILVSMIAKTWAETVGWPYSQGAEAAATRALDALTAAFTPTLTPTTTAALTTPTRHLPPF